MLVEMDKAWAAYLEGFAGSDLPKINALLLVKYKIWENMTILNGKSFLDN